MASGRRRDEPFDDADRGLLHALAAVGSGALSNAELYQQVHVERERLSSITLNIGEGVCAIDADGKLTFVNPAARRHDRAAVAGRRRSTTRSDGALAAPDFLLAPAREAMRTGRTIREDDARFRGKNGGSDPGRLHGLRGAARRPPSGAVIAFRDITERKAFEDELHHHAFYDSLTGLANRRLLVERLDQALRRSALDRKTHALIFVDVDRFKSINDSLGHVTGDEFLVAIGARHEGRGAQPRPARPLRRRRVRGAAGGRGRRGRGGRRGPAHLRGRRAAHGAARRLRDGGQRVGRHRADRAGQDRRRRAARRRRGHVRGQGQGRGRHLQGVRPGLHGHPLLRAPADRGRPAQGPRARRARGALPAVLLPRRTSASWAPRRWCGGGTPRTA